MFFTDIIIFGKEYGSIRRSIQNCDEKSSREEEGMFSNERVGGFARKANRREGIASTRDCSAAAPPSIQSKQNPSEHQSQQLNAILFTTTTARHTDIANVYECAGFTDAKV